MCHYYFDRNGEKMNATFRCTLEENEDKCCENHSIGLPRCCDYADTVSSKVPLILG